MSTETFDAPAQLAGLVHRGVRWPAERLAVRPADDAPVRRSAVLLLFGALRPGTPASPRDLDLLVVRRSTRLRHHPGQVALPGGGVEPADADAAATALREAREETDVDPAGVEVLGELAPIGVPVSGNLVTPVVAWWRTPGAVRPADPHEIDLVRRVPLSELVDPARRVRAEFSHGEGPSGPARSTPGIELDQALMWGFTGLVVTTVLDELGWGPRTDWDAARAVDVARWVAP